MNTEKIVAKFEGAQDALVLQASDLSLQTIAQMVATGAIDIAPKYQRRDRWGPEAQSELVESFLLNVPVPPVYLAEDDFGTYSVIDGKQRITTISRFLTGEFQLSGLAKFSEVNGCHFQELPKQLQNALSIRPYLRVVTLLKQTDPDLKYEVFTRLNTGGEPLLPQEIRNALYRGSFNDALFTLAESEFLRQQLKIKTLRETPYTEMQDVEAVLRFLCLEEEWQHFSGDMRHSLDMYAAAHQHDPVNKLEQAKKRFHNALARCESLWGKAAFRRYDGNSYRDQFMSAVYDAQMIAAGALTQTKFASLAAKKQAVEAGTINLFKKDPKFVDAVRVSTNSPSRVQYRIQRMKEMLSQV